MYIQLEIQISVGKWANAVKSVKSKFLQGNFFVIIIDHWICVVDLISSFPDNIVLTGRILGI